MREILFRGKRVDNGEWVEGLLGSKRTILVESPIEHYRTAKSPNDLVAMANQDATLSVMLGATPDAAYGFIETAKAVAAEKGWELPEGEE